MPERESNKPRRIYPGVLRREMGIGGGNDLAFTILYLIPQVALWQMARESEGEVLSTTSSEVIDFVRRKYFVVDPQDLIYAISTFLMDAEEEEFNFGFSYSRPPVEEWPKRALGTERDYLIIKYPKSSARFRLAYNLNPENLGKVAEVSKILGGENSLGILYRDGKEMWEEETGTKLPSDHKTPEWFKSHWEKLYEAKEERDLREQQALVRRVWRNVKDYFDKTEEDYLRGDPTDRYSALFDLMGVYQAYPLLSRATSSAVTSFDGQWERDDRVLMEAISQSTSYENFLEEVDKGVAKRMEEERGYRKAINEMHIELYNLRPKKRFREMRSLLTQAGYLNEKDRISKEIFWDQAEVIEAVEMYFKKAKGRQEAVQSIQEDERLSGQEIGDLLSFFMV